MAVLSKARELKHADYDRIHAREDFSDCVQTKWQALMKLQRELRQRGVKANMSFDKLIAGDSVYTNDMASNPPSGRPGAADKQQGEETIKREETIKSMKPAAAGRHRDGHQGTTNDLWPTVTPEHRPRSSPASSNYLPPAYLLPTTKFLLCSQGETRLWTPAWTTKTWQK